MVCRRKLWGSLGRQVLLPVDHRGLFCPTSDCLKRKWSSLTQLASKRKLHLSTIEQLVTSLWMRQMARQCLNNLGSIRSKLVCGAHHTREPLMLSFLASCYNGDELLNCGRGSRHHGYFDQYGVDLSADYRVKYRIARISELRKRQKTSRIR